MQPPRTGPSPLYQPLPVLLGGEDTQPFSADVNHLLPYPNGVKIPTNETVNNQIRYRTLLLDNDINVARQSNTEPTPVVMTDEDTPSKPDVSERPNKVGRPNGKKLKLSKSEQKYSIYTPLLSLWLQYAKNLKRDDPTTFADRVLRMDLHGAPVTVIRARDPGLVGHSGIVVAETANSLLIVTKRNRAITILKNVSVVSINFDNVSVELFLPALAYRASERSARKIKKKHLSHF